MSYAFPDWEEVEYPLDVVRMGGTLRVRRRSLTVILDHAAARPSGMNLREASGAVRAK